MDVYIDNEYKQLKKVGMYLIEEYEIAPLIQRADEPVDLLYENFPDPIALEEELKSLATLLEGLGVEVVNLRDWYLAGYPNTIFVRDLALVVRDSIVISNPIARRQGEELLLSTFCEENSIPYFSPESSLEGADCLWVSSQKIIARYNARTERKSLHSLKNQLGVNILPVRYHSDRIPQHLLGSNLIVASDLYLYRIEKCPITPFEEFGFRPLKIFETHEIRDLYAMNMLVVSEKEVIMADDCPETKDMLEKIGFAVWTSPMKEIRKMGGGFSCVTLPLRREKNG